MVQFPSLPSFRRASIRDVLVPGVERHQSEADEGARIEDTSKSFIQRLTPVFACGAGLFSDGYINGVSGPVNTILKARYPVQYLESNTFKNIGSIQFVGIVVGQLLFGYTSDRFSRKWSLIVSTILLFVFNALATGSYGAGGSAGGLFAALAAWRFLTGIAIGGEYPAGSVSAAESTGELKSGSRNKWFIFFTNCTIDVGFVVATIVAMIVTRIAVDVAPADAIPSHLSTSWRVLVGIGCVAPASLIWARWKLSEPEAFKRESMSKTRIPYFLAFRFYWFRLLIVASVWWTYDFLSYGFGYYSSTITETVLADDAPLWKVFGWATVINAFYLPGAFAGGWVSDWIGPRYTLVIGVFCQAIIGFIMAGVYGSLSQPQNIAAFAVVYGIFLSFGELGPGDNIGLFAAKSCATPIRGQFYGIAAATGKIGAYIAIWVFPAIQKTGGDDPTKQNQNLFWVAASIAIFTTALAFFFLPNIGQDTIDHEDRRFRYFLEEHGYDTTTMGLDHSAHSTSSLEQIDQKTEYPPKEY